MNINIADFKRKFDEEYNFLYDAACKNQEVAGEREAAAAFDEFVKGHGAFVGEFAQYRRDFISSDREAAAFMFALESMIE